MVAEVCEGRRATEISRHRRGRFFSTVAVASDDAKSIQTSKKRLPKHERRIMVETFVNKYRTLNAGKFPTVSVAQKEVGGSFYVIREILQDLEYNFVHNPGAGISGNSLVETKGAENKIIPEQEFCQVEEVSCSHSQGGSHLFVVEEVPHAEEKVFTRDIQVLADKVEIGVEKTLDSEVERESTGFNQVNSPPLSRDLAGDVSTDQKIMCEEPERVSFNEQVNHLSNDEIEKHTESRQSTEMASFSEKTLLGDTLNPSAKEDKDEFLTRSNSVEAVGSSSMPYAGEPVLVDEKKDAKSCQDVVKPDISPSYLTDDQKCSTYDGLRGSSMDNSNDNNPQENPSMWTNLKSFADSIFSIWRKR